MKKVTSEWLDETNIRLADEEVEASDRVGLAIQEWRKNCLPDLLACRDSKADYQRSSFELDIELERIKSFYLTQSNLDRGVIQAQFAGIFYYYDDFWKFTVPLIAGRRTIRFLERIAMPADLVRSLAQDDFALPQFCDFCRDCIDYGYAIEEVESKCKTENLIQLFRSADKHLRACGSLLFQEKTSSKSIEDAAMAVEIFLKAYLSANNLATDKELKDKFGHNITKLSATCMNSGLTDLKLVAASLARLPRIEGRYLAPERVFGELWGAYRDALFVGTTVLRSLTGRDCRSMIAAK